MLGWGILIPIGAIIARYFKDWDPFWFYAHISVQSLGFILGVAGVSCGFVLKHKLGVIVSKHEGIGIFILVLGCLQVCQLSSFSLILSIFAAFYQSIHLEFPIS